MLKPTRSEITAQAPNLTPSGSLKTEDQKDAAAIVRQHPDYSPTDYPDLVAKLAAVTAYDAQAILAALAKIDTLGQKMTELELDGLLTRKKAEERRAWAAYIMTVLWDGPAAGEATATGALDDPTAAYWCSSCGSLCTCGGAVLCP